MAKYMINISHVENVAHFQISKKDITYMRDKWFEVISGTYTCLFTFSTELTLGQTLVNFPE